MKKVPWGERRGRGRRGVLTQGLTPKNTEGVPGRNGLKGKKNRKH